ncbi:thrombospondin type-1 domain-containing protein 4-like isoform X2 [Mizuhopecten yessoensis]|uniref:thrombospondin type-1 domain-containing protein 4-like isoform X2 n=1 Tax=Mizuhopecten yessoensis TaxID=6573 RepID=UPI000B45A1C1|nr:thrombospondin type-1 domain-containing protein 4-like isoform X2 [Mizuhopecten yessoensis]
MLVCTQRTNTAHCYTMGRRLNWYLGVVILLQVTCFLVKSESTCSQCDRGELRCKKISGIYTVRYLSQGYHPVVDIPEGACNVNVTEHKNSRNYLALKASTGHWILNGGWVKDKPGLYRGSGTQFRYDRDSSRCPNECIWGQGPLTHKVTVQLLYAWTNEGIVYEFTLPPGVEYTSPTNLVPEGQKAHRWRHHHNRRRHHSSSNSQNLSSTLVNPNNYGEHTSERTDPSFSQQTAVLPSTYSESKVRVEPQQPGNIRHHPPPQYVSPVETDSGYQALRSAGQSVRYGRVPQYTGNREALTGGDGGSSHALQIPTNADRSLVLQSVYSWSIAGFTACTHTCGSGTQETNIVCVLKTTQVHVTDDNCDVSLRPPKQTVSCNKSPCPPQWELHPWSVCSVTCGRGTQSRRVECKRRISGEEQLSVSASLCDAGEKPAIVQQCETDPCTRWQTGDWGQCSVNCGAGEKQRTVQCVDARDRPVRAELCDSPTPRDVETCNQGPCEHHWFLSQWSHECSSTCSGGVQTRSVHCATIRGHKALDVSCGLDSRPADQQQCNNTRSTRYCGNSWFAGPWSQCSTSCGDGLKSRHVLCLEVDSSHNSRAVSLDMCDNRTKPLSQEPCHQSSCGAQWHMSEWTQCPVTCGEGQVTRTVMCLDRNKQPVSSCEQSDRPTSRDTCNQQACIASLSDADPSCKDRYGNCQLVVQARLCRYDYYRQICCASCYPEQKVN